MRSSRRALPGILQRTSSSPSRWVRFSPDRPDHPSVVDAHGRALPPRLTPSWWRLSWKSSRTNFFRIFLPEGYPAAVHPYYVPFISWNFVQMVLGSAAGVLSTQSLLYGLGLSTGSLALSSTLNWILKDGLGQLGGIWIISYLGGRFDVETKRFRLLAAILLKLSCVLEILVPLCPRYFILTASLANILKNVCWMATSATRAQIHRHMAKRDNLGDISGKAASQNSFASLIGTGIGVLLSTVFVSRQLGSPLESVSRCLLIVAPLSAMSLLAAYQSCLYAVSPRLNLTRMEIVLYQAFSELFAKQSRVARPEVLHSLKRYISSPETITRREPFMFSATSERLTGTMSRVPLLVEPLIAGPVSLSGALYDDGQERRKFWIRLAAEPTVAISIWFGVDANEADMLRGLFCSFLLKYFLSSNVSLSVGEAEEMTEGLLGAFREGLQARGWALDEIHLGTRRPLKFFDADGPGPS